jgi:excinuclease ABC subunit B
LTFTEFEALAGTSIYVSATPADYELMKSEGMVVEQVVRPTGVVDPPIQIRTTDNQIDDLIEEIQKRAAVDEKVLVATLTKRMAEELSKYFDRIGIRNRYIHSEVETLDRIRILEDLRAGSFDVLIGVNLLREGLDLPEVSLVAVMDADKEGFLRNTRSLTQIAGRAARHAGGNVILYAEHRTDSIREAIAESNRRREKQIAYNMRNQIVPLAARKSSRGNILIKSAAGSGASAGNDFAYDFGADGASAAVRIAADVKAVYTTGELDAAIADARRRMEAAARELDFAAAARWRNIMYSLQGRNADGDSKLR